MSECVGAEWEAVGFSASTKHRKCRMSMVRSLYTMNYVYKVKPNATPFIFMHVIFVSSFREYNFLFCYFSSFCVRTMQKPIYFVTKPNCRWNWILFLLHIIFLDILVCSPAYGLCEALATTIELSSLVVVVLMNVSNSHAILHGFGTSKSD